MTDTERVVDVGCGRPAISEQNQPAINPEDVAGIVERLKAYKVDNPRGYEFGQNAMIHPVLTTEAATALETLSLRLARVEAARDKAVEALEAVEYFWCDDPKAFGDEATVTSLAGQFEEVAAKCRATLAQIGAASHD